MRNAHPAQLPLLDLPPASPRPDGGRRRTQAATNAQHCQALLAALGRVALEQRDRAEHLAGLFEACERAASAPDHGMGATDAARAAVGE